MVSWSATSKLLFRLWVYSSCKSSPFNGGSSAALLQSWDRLVAEVCVLQVCHIALVSGLMPPVRCATTERGAGFGHPGSYWHLTFLHIGKQISLFLLCCPQNPFSPNLLECLGEETQFKELLINLAENLILRITKNWLFSEEEIRKLWENKQNLISPSRFLPTKWK